MKELLKDNKVVLVLILVLAFGLRLWDLNHPINLWAESAYNYSQSLRFPFDFFEGIKTNSHAPLHYFYLKLWMSIFKNSTYMLKMSSLIPGVLGCLAMYFAGKNYFSKDNSIKIGLTCALITAISSYLIFFSQEVRVHSLVFLLSSLILLFSIKMYENPSSKNAVWIFVLSVLLILEHTIGFVYVLFNMFGLLAFRNGGKKKKGQDDHFVTILSMLVLSLPLIPFLLKMFSHPTWVSRWWFPFKWSNICYMFSDFFSPVLKNVSIQAGSFYHHIIQGDIFNIGFILFALVPTITAVILIVRANIDSKRIDKYLLSVFLASFLTILITAIAGKISFLTKYFTELYPILILMASIGWVNLNSRNTKITLATIYIFLTLFYMVSTKFLSISLI